jgi:hypothetical protein
MKKIVLIVTATTFCFNAFAGFKDSCIVTYYTYEGRTAIAHSCTVPVDFYSGYEMNKQNSNNEHIDNSVIAIIHSNELNNPTVYAKDLKIDSKQLTAQELEKGLVKFHITYGANIMFANDEHGGYWELVLK